MHLKHENKQSFPVKGNVWYMLFKNAAPSLNGITQSFLKTMINIKCLLSL